MSGKQAAAIAFACLLIAAGAIYLARVLRETPEEGGEGESMPENGGLPQQRISPIPWTPRTS